MAFPVGSNVTISGKVVEVVSNEDFGTRYSVKLKSNDKMVILNFEEDEISGGSNTPSEDPVEP